ncbi:PucR family transcriptional regulator [Kribbella flavida]|uniref:PucR family transcriptional regulator n=1 Tax=Kribbella flavida TaxID=182640 RepID=UPI001ED8E926|nr:helix-turn-helix domain-containing protein [Kribbella flavida]
MSSATAIGAASFQIGEPILRVLGERLGEVAADTVEAVTAEVPEYAGALGGAGSMGPNIEAAVQMALGGFLKLAGGARDADPSTPLGPTIEGAYALGRGEARGGRSMDALLAAYRVGARVAWRKLAQAAADAGLPATTMAKFAELLFAYIDELSAASVAGHADELSTSGRVLERYRERLGRHLLAGAPHDVLLAAAERAEWTPPGSLTAVLLPPVQARGALASLGAATLQVGEELPGLDQAGQPFTLLLVPDVDGPGRRHLLRVLAGRHAVVGPARPWAEARSSYERAARTVPLARTRTADPVDSDHYLADLVLGADPAARADLRARVLEPLGVLPSATQERLAETLISWLLHQGRREEVAAELHVHAQTVRYRMGQLRGLYGDRLTDPRFVRELILALPARGEAGS